MLFVYISAVALESSAKNTRVFPFFPSDECRVSRKNKYKRDYLNYGFHLLLAVVVLSVYSSGFYACVSTSKFAVEQCGSKS
jgi:hypothetical protein